MYLLPYEYQYYYYSLCLEKMERGCCFFSVDNSSHNVCIVHLHSSLWPPELGLLMTPPQSLKSFQFYCCAFLVWQLQIIQQIFFVSFPFPLNCALQPALSSFASPFVSRMILAVGTFPLHIVCKHLSCTLWLLVLLSCPATDATNPVFWSTRSCKHFILWISSRYCNVHSLIHLCIKGTIQ